MPKPGQMTEECTIVAWLKHEGDAVAAGDVLFEIETDKSNMDVEAFDAGVLLRIVVPEGGTAPVNAVCAWIGERGEAIPDAADAPLSAAVASEGVASATAASATDVSAAATSAAAASAAAVQDVRASGRKGAAGTARLRISPRASRLAIDAGLDPRTIPGSGPDGRIVERDVRKAIAETVAAAAAAPPTPAPPASAASAAFPTPSVGGEVAPRPLTRMRRVIAERLTGSWTSTPHFTVTVAADVTRLLAVREELRERGTSLSVTDFVLAATAQTLAEFPAVNGRTDGVSWWPRTSVHLGLAVSVPDGLLVPIIRDADRLSVSEIHERAAELAAAARAGSLGPDEMTGGTFTVSNLGMFGVEAFSAIINPGEAAILAVSSALPIPVVVGDGIAVRSIMRLTLSADHRLVDGEMGARFLGAVRRRLEDGASFRIEVANA